MAEEKKTLEERVEQLEKQAKNIHFNIEGINTSLFDHIKSIGALTELLIEKEIITREEFDKKKANYRPTIINESKG